MAKYCADCYHMDECPNREGLFKCLNSRKSLYNYVSARRLAVGCAGFGEAWQSRRGERAREEYMAISRKHGYYLVTAISEILNVPEPNEYLSCFQYIRDVYMPEKPLYQGFIDEYEYLAPNLSSKLMSDANVDYYAAYLLAFYLEPFVSLVHEGQYEEASKQYIEMFEAVKSICKPRVMSKRDKRTKRLMIPSE